MTPQSAPGTIVNCGVGNTTNTTISNVGNNNSIEEVYCKCCYCTFMGPERQWLTWISQILALVASEELLDINQTFENDQFCSNSEIAKKQRNSPLQAILQIFPPSPFHFPYYFLPDSDYIRSEFSGPEIAAFGSLLRNTNTSVASQTSQNPSFQMLKEYQANERFFQHLMLGIFTLQTESSLRLIWPLRTGQKRFQMCRYCGCIGPLGYARPIPN